MISSDRWSELNKIRDNVISWKIIDKIKLVRVRSVTNSNERSEWEWVERSKELEAIPRKPGVRWGDTHQPRFRLISLISPWLRRSLNLSHRPMIGPGECWSELSWMGICDATHEPWPVRYDIMRSRWCHWPRTCDLYMLRGKSQQQCSDTLSVTGTRFTIAE
jgi:hypothetical protein